MKKLYTLSIFIYAVLISSAQNPWAQKTNIAGIYRSGAGAFTIGTKGYVACGSAGSFHYGDLWEWDQASDSWSQKANLGITPWLDCTAGFSIGNTGYIATGMKGSFPTNYYWTWDQSSDTWTQKTNFSGTSRQKAVAFSIGAKGYLGTGTNGTENTSYNDFWEYDPGSGSWTQKANFPGTARFGATGFSIGTNGYIGTGASPSTTYKDFYEYDQGLNLWTKKADYPVATQYAVGFSIDSNGYIGTGVGNSKVFYQWNASTNVWKKTSDFPGKAKISAVGFSIGTKGYVGTGSGTNPDDFWEYDPSQDCRLKIPSIFTASSYTVTQYDTVNFTNNSTGVASYTWLVNGTVFSTSTNPQYSFPDQGTYTISLATSNGVCSDTSRAYITVKCATVLISNFQCIPNPAIYIDDTVLFTNTSIGATSYAWYINGSPFSYSKDASYVFSAPNIYTVTLLDSNSTGCSHKKDTSIIVQPCADWKQKANMGAGRRNAVGFSIGTKGYIGTGEDGSYELADFWEWNQGTNTWAQKANYGGGNRASAVGFSIGTKGYIGTGANNHANGNYKDFWEWNQTTNVWTQKADFGGGYRAGAFGFSIGTKGYIGTGVHSTAYKDFWEWDQSTNTWTKKADYPGLSSLECVGFSIGTKGYAGIGIDKTNNVLKNDFWEWDQATDTWTKKADFGGGNRAAAVGFSMGAKGYIATGRDQNIVTYSDFWEYSPSTDTWLNLANLPQTRTYGAGFSIGIKGYIATGSVISAAERDLWQYYPSCGNSPTKAEEKNKSITLDIFPNPSSGNFSLKISPAKGELVIYNLQGGKIYFSKNNSERSEIDLRAQPDGIYFLQLKTGKEEAVRKIIVNH